jgi:hypothetical protein
MEHVFPGGLTDVPEVVPFWIEYENDSSPTISDINIVISIHSNTGWFAEPKGWTTNNTEGVAASRFQDVNGDLAWIGDDEALTRIGGHEGW